MKHVKSNEYFVDGNYDDDNVFECGDDNDVHNWKYWLLF